ncbi:MAG: class I mannose-6-phosphate isomerase [Anaerolineales bacterium]|jgi:mannose-6-phosphate isomerase|nr:class I mannose-6-phosphate isomerase [Anaerolineales bacterium]
MKIAPLILEATLRNYVWGGRALQALAGADTPADLPIAEVWAIYEHNRIVGGPFAGRSLAELLEDHASEILGTRARQERFPLLIKLLDCARWLSLQVHPDDRLACELEGPGFMGKTEAWYILGAAPDSELIAGLKPNTTPAALADAIRAGEKILDLVEYHPVQTGDTVFMPAGTIHALGPGLLAYEVQQTSDLTYRVFDWNRPRTGGRELHIEKSLAVSNPHARGQIQRFDSQQEDLVSCDYFQLERLSLPQTRDTRGESFHALTVIDGVAQLQTEDGLLTLAKFDSALIPACVGSYQLRGNFQVLCASLAA